MDIISKIMINEMYNICSERAREKERAIVYIIICSINKLDFLRS